MREAHDCNPSGYHARAKPLIKREALAWFPFGKQSRAFKSEDFKRKNYLNIIQKVGTSSTH
jgi:hypothetical protein